MLKAIETVYKGYRFRSRLEARWAVFFNALDIRWEYEKEGYDLGPAGWYLPDFWLPEQDCWVEIKGDRPSQSETRKCIVLAEESQKDLVLFSAEYGFGLPYWDNTEYNFRGSWGRTFWRDHYDDEGDLLAWWEQCHACSKFFIGSTHRADEHVARHRGQLSAGHDGQINWYGDARTPRLLQAYGLAQAARFEHGESPP